MKTRNWKVVSITMMVVGLMGMSGVAGALTIDEVEPNSTFETAQNIDASFSLEYDENIESGESSNDSTTIPHVSIQGTGDGTFDFYSFTVTSASVLGFFDVDFAEDNDLDAHLQLFDSAGNLLAENDDSDFDGPGDVYLWTFNSFLEYTFDAGEYIIGVAMSYAEAVPFDTAYTLHTSIQGHALWNGNGDVPNAVAAPEPGTVFMLGIGVLGLIGAGRKKLFKK